MFNSIISFFKGLFGKRSARIVTAEKITDVLVTFQEGTYSSLVVTILETLAPTESTLIGIVKTFLDTALPNLLKALKLMDASDNSTDEATNEANVVAAVKLLDADKASTVLTLVKESLENDGELSLLEAENIVLKLS